MPTRRAHVRRNERRLPTNLRASAERLLELQEAHTAAIRGTDRSFYNDGRHQELVDLLPIINQALGIKPWHDMDAMLRDALEASNLAEER